MSKYCYIIISNAYLWYIMIPGCLADSILIPTPFYGVITEDIDLYSSVKLYCVPLDSEVIIRSPFTLFCTSVLLWQSVKGLCWIFFPFSPDKMMTDRFTSLLKNWSMLSRKQRKRWFMEHKISHTNIHTLAFKSNYRAGLFFLFVCFEFFFFFLQGVNIKAMILLNPHNPLGEIYTSEEMISFLNVAKRLFY